METSPVKPVVYAYATLVTNNAYVDASLVVAKALQDLKTNHELVVLITPNDVSKESIKRLKCLYDAVIPVTPMFGVSTKNLSLIGRPDLHATLTKLHLWSLIQYSRVLYLDADTLPLQNLDHLFELLAPSAISFAAAPEVGYPDTFNSGLMFLTPDKDTYDELKNVARTHESYDGGDQGLLNVFFGDGTMGHPLKQLLGREGARLDSEGHIVGNQQQQNAPVMARSWYRLSYTYNMELHKVYRLNIPAVLRYRAEHKVVHFIGKDKPWHFVNGKVDMPAEPSPYIDFYGEMVGEWWKVRRSLCDI